MYLKFYGLSEKPFSQTPDPRFLYWNDSYREALASLRYGVQERKGFLTMIGEAGTGKTTLLRKLLDDLGPDAVSVLLFNPNATFEEILEYTLSELGVMVPSGRKLAMLQRLNEFLLAAFAEGKNTILVIDEAQDLETEVLESLRLLSNLETSREKILQIVLSGQPELATRLAQDNLRQLKQRIAVRCRLEPLQRSELAEFIRARLRVAGGDEGLFHESALDGIWRFANGIPRLVNTVCDNALLVGYAVGKRQIDAEVIGEVVQDLNRLDATDAPPVARPAPAPAAPATAAPPPSAAPPPPSAAAPAAAAPAAAAPSAAPVPPLASAPAAAPAAGPSPATPHVGATSPGPRSERGRHPERRPPGSGLALAAGAALLLGGGIWLGTQLRSDPEPIPVPPEQRAAAIPREPAPAPPPPVARVEVPQPVPQVNAAAPAIDPLQAPSTNEPPATQGAAPDEPSPARRETVAPAPQAEAPPPAPRSAPDSAAPPGGPVAGSNRPPERGADAAPAGARDGSPAPAAADLARRDEPAAAALPRSPAALAAVAERAPSQRTAPPSATLPAQDVQDLRGGASPDGQRILVQPGDTLYQLAWRTYGTANFTTLDMLRAANPGVQDVNRIVAGRVLVFPDPGPTARILESAGSQSVLALTTPAADQAAGVQRKLQEQFGQRVAVEPVVLAEGQRLYRVSLTDIHQESQARAIAESLGTILSDPQERPGS